MQQDASVNRVQTFTEKIDVIMINSSPVSSRITKAIKDFTYVILGYINKIDLTSLKLLKW